MAQLFRGYGIAEKLEKFKDNTFIEEDLYHELALVRLGLESSKHQRKNNQQLVD
jgi:hypothetical protein